MACLNPDGWTIILGNGAAEGMDLQLTKHEALANWVLVHRVDIHCTTRPGHNFINPRGGWLNIPRKICLFVGLGNTYWCP